MELTVLALLVGGAALDRGAVHLDDAGGIERHALLRGDIRTRARRCDRQCAERGGGQNRGLNSRNVSQDDSPLKVWPVGRAYWKMFGLVLTVARRCSSST